jgi:hypothetical protein
MRFPEVGYPGEFQRAVCDFFFFLATVFPELLPAVARGFCIEEER